MTTALPEAAVSADGTINVTYEDRRHRYTVNGEWVPSVSGVIGAYDKPALVGAAAKVTLQGVATLHSECTIENGRTCLVFDDADQLASALYANELRHWQVWGKTADRGTFVHGVNQAWTEDGRVPTRDDVPTSYVGYVQGFGAFVVDHEPRFLSSEAIVASAKWGYAGRYDVVGILTKECANPACGCHDVIGLTGRWDYKTAKALYPENMAQLDLYEVAAVEMGEDQADYRAPLRLGADGTYEFSVSRLPFGASLGLVEGYKARALNADIHKHLNPRKGRQR